MKKSLVRKGARWDSKADAAGSLLDSGFEDDDEILDLSKPRKYRWSEQAPEVAGTPGVGWSEGQGSYICAANTLGFWRPESLRSGVSRLQVTHHFRKPGSFEIGPCPQTCYCCSTCRGQSPRKLSNPALSMLLQLVELLVASLNSLGVRTCERKVLWALEMEDMYKWDRPHLYYVTPGPREDPPFVRWKARKPEPRTCQHFSHHVSHRATPMGVLYAKTPKKPSVAGSTSSTKRTRPKPQGRRLGQLSREELVRRYGTPPSDDDQGPEICLLYIILNFLRLVILLALAGVALSLFSREMEERFWGKK